MNPLRGVCQYSAGRGKYLLEATGGACTGVRAESRGKGRVLSAFAVRRTEGTSGRRRLVSRPPVDLSMRHDSSGVSSLGSFFGNVAGGRCFVFWVVCVVRACVACVACGACV